MAKEMVIHASDETFEGEVLKSPIPVLVDFWAVWCAPCHMIAPTVENIAQKYPDSLKVVKVNVDENMKSPAKYGIRGIPTLLFFKDGELKETIVGVHPENKIIEMLSKYL